MHSVHIFFSPGYLTAIAYMASTWVLYRSSNERYALPCLLLPHADCLGEVALQTNWAVESCSYRCTFRLHVCVLHLQTYQSDTPVYRGAVSAMETGSRSDVRVLITEHKCVTSEIT